LLTGLFDSPEYEPYAYDVDGYLLGVVLPERTTGTRKRYQKVCSEAKFLQMLSMEIDREILQLATVDRYRSSRVEEESERDDEPCSKNAKRMVAGANALIAHLSSSGVPLPRSHERLSELGGVHRAWGHWYRPLDSEPFYREGAGALALICCKGHRYRIDLKFNSSKKWEIVLNRNIAEALGQHEHHEPYKQVAC
jgi:hypothetical protein